MHSFGILWKFFLWKINCFNQFPFYFYCSILSLSLSLCFLSRNSSNMQLQSWEKHKGIWWKGTNNFEFHLVKNNHKIIFFEMAYIFCSPLGPSFLHLCFRQKTRQGKLMSKKKLADWENQLWNEQHYELQSINYYVI